MKRLLLAAVAALLLAVPVVSQERLTLAAPKPLPVQVTDYTISALLLKWAPTPQIVVTLLATDGTTVDAVYEGATATTLLVQLNRANLTTRSLNQRIFDRLVADGKLAGTVGGSVP